MRLDAARPPARLSVLVLLAALLGATASYFLVDGSVLSERTHLSHTAQTRAVELLLARTEARLSPALEAGDESRMKAVAEAAYYDDPTLDGVRLRLPSGAMFVLGSFHEGSHRLQSGILEVASDDPARLHSDLKQRPPAIERAGPVLGGVVLMFAALGFYVRRRLLKLARVAHELAAGRFNDIESISGRDEVAWIGTNLHTLSDLLREQVDRVHGRNANLLRSVTLQGDRLDRLARFAAQLIAPVEKEAAADAALSALLTHTDAVLAVLVGPQIERGETKVVGCAGLSLTDAERSSGEDIPGIPLFSIATADEVVVAPALTPDHPWLMKDERKIPLQGVLGVPLRYQGALQGVLLVAARGTFPEHEIAFFRDCARPLAIALANHRAYHKQVALAHALSERNDDLLAQRSELEAAVRLRKQFVANISHELRTPLGAILGYSELLLDEIYGDLAPDQRPPLEGIQETGTHLLQLVNQVLDLSRAEHDFDIDPQPCDVRDVALEALRMSSHLSKDRPYTPRVIGEPVSLVTDVERVRQIVVNLLANAMKFTEQGAVTVSIQATPGGGANIAVKDTGLGIDETNVELIFQEFRQVDGSSTRAADGAGLGLAISRRLARVLGGDLTVSSRLGEGSTFTLSLPPSPPEKGRDLTPLEQAA